MPVEIPMKSIVHCLHHEIAFPLAVRGKKRVGGTNMEWGRSSSPFPQFRAVRGIAIFFFAVLMAAGIFNEDAASASEEPETVVEISIDRLFNEFGPDRDNDEAFAKYGNRVFRFKGFVKSVEEDADGRPFLVVYSFSARPLFAHCHLGPDGTTELDTLPRKGTMRFQGRCQGFSAERNALVFEECQVAPAAEGELP